MTAMALTWPTVIAHRLTQQHLLDPVPTHSPATVARAVCGIHAQVLPAAELSLGIRLPGSTRRTVRAALWDERSLVKTYGIRGTIHLFPSADYPCWMAALRVRARSGEPQRLARIGLSVPRLEAITRALANALDGRRLTLKELDAQLSRRVGSWVVEERAPAFAGDWPLWRMALGWAAAHEAVCFGPNQGNEATFVRPDQWLRVPPAVLPPPTDEERAVLGDVYLDYLRTYGPLTYREFVQWFNLPRTLARWVEASVQSHLVTVQVDGFRGYWPTASAAPATPSALPSVHLLPHFDCYLRGSFPREQLVGPWAQRAGGGTGNIPVLLVDGRVGGIWQRRERRGCVEITVEPFVELSAAHRHSLEAAATRIGEFLELPADLTLGAVHARPHL